MIIKIIENQRNNFSKSIYNFKNSAVVFTEFMAKKMKKRRELNNGGCRCSSPRGRGTCRAEIFPNLWYGSSTPSMIKRQ